MDKRQVMCVILGISLFAAGTFVENRASGLRDGRGIVRNTYGQGAAEQEVTVKGLLEKELPLNLSVQERQYGQEEAEAAFEPAYEELLAGMAGENESLDSVRTDLNLVTWLEEYGIAVEWDSDQRELVDADGRVNGLECPEEGREVFLTACLKAGAYSRTYVMKVRVCPPVRTEEELRAAAFKKLLGELDQEQGTREEFTLPESFEGRELAYEIPRQGDYWIFLLLGAAAAVCIPLKERQDEREQKKRRERQLLLDYSEIVSKLVVFLGAGLPVRKAWERIVKDYEEKKRSSGILRYAYEEMENAYFLMSRGVPETRAYAEFGSRCRILPYRKLAGILTQNVKNGSEKLRPMLEAEMEEAFEQRKTLARRLGEEAGTKLLLPLFMLLAVVMVLISVPAFLSFGI